MNFVLEDQHVSKITNEFYKLMKYERLRLITFFLYKHQWPKLDIVYPDLLANAGFFYYKDDSVRCVFCRGTVRNWEKGIVYNLIC